MKPESRDALPWSPPLARRRKGVVHLPASHDLDSRDRDALLTAIAKARSWIDDLINGRVQSFDEIADREQKVVRHIRFLVPLAFLSPRIVAAIANGDVSAGVTVKRARSFPVFQLGGAAAAIRSLLKSTRRQHLD
jgi:site-specific DNA recombinase